MNQSKGKARPKTSRATLIPLSKKNQAPVSSSVVIRTPKPQITTLPDGAVRVRHAELVGNVNGTINWNVQFNLTVNPGCETTFPWLSTIGLNYEKYSVNKLDFVYKTRCATSQQGSVQIGYDYNPEDSAPGTEAQLSNYQGTVEDAPWKDIRMSVRPQQIRKDLLIRGSYQSVVDVPDYDAGNMYVATVDAGANNAYFGKLWVEYDFTFKIPTTRFALGAASISAYQPSASSTALLGTTATTETTGNITVSTTGNTITLSGVVPGNTYVLNAGMAGTGISNFAFASQSGQAIKTAICSLAINSAATFGMVWYTVTPTATSVTMTFSGNATTITTFYLTYSALVPAPIF